MAEEQYQPHCVRKAAKIIYFSHLTLCAVFTTYILLVNPTVISFTITFVMLMIYGYMLGWVLLLNFIFIVALGLFRCARGRRRRCASTASW